MIAAAAAAPPEQGFGIEGILEHRRGLLFDGATGERFGAIKRKAYAKGFERRGIGKIRRPALICPESRQFSPIRPAKYCDSNLSAGD
jgi:hypothetical protein